MIDGRWRFDIGRGQWGTAKRCNLVELVEVLVDGWLAEPLIPIVLFHQRGYLSLGLDDGVHPQKTDWRVFDVHCMVHNFGLDYELTLRSIILPNQAFERTQFIALLRVLFAFSLELR